MLTKYSVTVYCLKEVVVVDHKNHSVFVQLADVNVHPLPIAYSKKRSSTTNQIRHGSIFIS